MKNVFFAAWAVALLLLLPGAGQAVDFTYITNLDNTITITGYDWGGPPGGTVVIQDLIEELPVTDFGTVFQYDATITSLTIGTNVTRIVDSAFESCTGLTSVTIPDSVITIGDYAFYDCASLLNMDIPTRVITLGESAFDSCLSLSSVTIGTNVTTIGTYAFYDCDGLTSVTIPASVTSIGDYVFEKCTYLTEITVNAGNSFYSSLDGVLFNHSQTMLIKHPEGNARSNYTITNSVTVIEDSSFFSCNNLDDVTIPDSVTDIRDYAFCSCTNLTHAVIGNTVTKVGTFVFADSTKLTQVYFRGNAPTYVGSSVFYGATNATVYRLSSATGWPTVPNTWAGRPTALWDQQDADTDADGLPDWWEEQYFYGPTNADPTAICSNGFNTVFDAYIAGLNPTNAASTFQISDFRTLTSGSTLHWQSVSGHVYSVHWTSNLLSGFQCLESNIPWTQSSYTNPTAVPCGYYKIDVRLP